MDMHDSLADGKLHKAIPAIELIDPDLSNILARAIWAFHHYLHLVLSISP